MCPNSSNWESLYNTRLDLRNKQCSKSWFLFNFFSYTKKQGICIFSMLAFIKINITICLLINKLERKKLKFWSFTVFLWDIEELTFLISKMVITKHLLVKSFKILILHTASLINLTYVLFLNTLSNKNRQILFPCSKSAVFLKTI